MLARICSPRAHATENRASLDRAFLGIYVFAYSVELVFDLLKLSHPRRVSPKSASRYASGQGERSCLLRCSVPILTGLRILAGSCWFEVPQN